MDSQERALLEEIIENPDDHIPRLIYADWLEERGNPRAEFIRVQCELEHTTDDSLKRQLREKEKQLLLLHEGEWTKEMNREHVPYLRFRRGFVKSIQTTVPYLLTTILRQYHLRPIQSLHLLAGPGDLRPLKGIGELRNIRKLSLSGNAHGVKGVTRLCECENLESLRELYLTSCQIDHASISLLVDSPLLSGLQTLLLGGNSFGDEGASVLAASPRLSNLEQLGVSFCNIGDGGAAALTNSTSFRKLHTLRFAGNAADNQTLNRMVARFGAGLLLN